MEITTLTTEEEEQLRYDDRQIIRNIVGNRKVNEMNEEFYEFFLNWNATYSINFTNVTGLSKYNRMNPSIRKACKKTKNKCKNQIEEWFKKCKRATSFMKLYIR